LFYYFENPENNLPIREAIEFYKHSEGWSNRLIAGDSLIVMNSLLEKEGMAGKVQMIYIDPPYGIKYGSNFQPFINKKDVKDGKDEDLTQEPETIKAFRDTWKLGIHSYLTYLRDRLLLSKDLLTETGSVFVQMNDENLHHVREIMDEVFGPQNFVAVITYQTATNQNTKTIQRLHDYLIWYSKTNNPKVRHLFREYTQEERSNIFNNVDKKNRRFKAAQFRDNWTETQIENLRKSDRIYGKYVKRFETDFEYTEYDTVWDGTVISTFSKEKVYAVQTSTVPIKRCILMTTDPGDLVLDITCGSGTTAYVAEQYGRRWITCDTSRVAIALAKQRLMTALFEYYELAHPDEGLSSGFKYQTTPHITISSIANGEPVRMEILYDKPVSNNTKKRVTGPFTVEAVPSQRVLNLEEVHQNANNQDADNSIARSGETVRQSDWIDELSKTGIRAKGRQTLKFSRIEPLQGTKWLQAEGETQEGKKAFISFGPEYAPLEERQVELAIEEARQLSPKPLVIFASFQFDPEAAKNIDELKWPGVTAIKCQMNTDLLTDDLKKKEANEESSFWLIGQPDIELKKQGEKYVVTVNGFDYYDTRTGEIKSGSSSNIAMWELDTDYNGRSLYPRQVFFPLEGENGGWSKLAKALQAYVDEDLISNYAGNQSLPFKTGKNKQIAVKIIDDRGIESLRVLKVD
jgi:adenine-specific DNA-methyltransferase